MKAQRTQQGFSWVESLITIATISIFIALIGSIYSTLKSNYYLRKAANAFITKVEWGRNHAAQTRSNLHLSFQVSDSSWCFGVTDAQSCDCSATLSCSVGGQEHVISGSAFPGVRLLLPAQHFSFTGLKKTVSEGKVDFINSEGKQLTVVVSGLGRARHCSPADDAHLTSAPSCT